MKKARIISTNILCSLGSSTDEVFARVVAGESGVNENPNFEALESLYVSQIDNEELDALFSEIYSQGDSCTRFEKMAILSLDEAAKRGDINLADDKLLIILSTTKGNIELLDKEGRYSERLLLSSSAKVISSFFGNQNRVVIISNACISGVVALIEAQRYLADGDFEKVAVVGCDTLTKFVIAGFGCFKALAPTICRPFDIDREGLNLGEAAATVVLDWMEAEQGDIYLEDGAITNDATHISAPSRTAEGLFAAINRCDTSGADFIMAHGTATPYNDPMEAVAINRAKLENIPTLSLKAIFGHTLGAAGVIETIIGCKMLQDGVLLPSIGFQNQGVQHPIRISTELKNIEMSSFLKTISGFGGCNAALVIRKEE